MPIRRGSVLVVEDDEDVRFVCSEVLQARGFSVTACATLRDALAEVEHRTPDVLLLDRELPDGGGLDFARWLRQRPLYDDVRIVGFSGRKAPHEIAEALGAGCDTFLAKPSTPTALIGRIEDLLAARPQSSSVVVSADRGITSLPQRPGTGRRHLTEGD